MSQTTDTILMVRPRGFRSNEQTVSNNHFQNVFVKESGRDLNSKALEEFETLVRKLEEVHVRVFVADYPEDVDTPDRIFPNNWISTHAEGRIAIYPMYAPNRRKERRNEIIDLLKKESGSELEITDLTFFEKAGIYLEGTGSLVLDRVNKIAYAAISERTSEEVVSDFCSKLGYKPIVFHANHFAGDKRVPIYHTNVMMSIGEKIAVVCTSCIDNLAERKKVIEKLSATHRLVEITEEQVDRFAGNMLEVSNTAGQRFMIMSSAAYNSLNAEQLAAIESCCIVLHSSLDTIEKSGGGSARCMMAEVFYPQKK